MQAKCVIIQDNWQAVPLYEKSWWSVGNPNFVDEALRLLLQRRTQRKQQKFWISTHFLEILKVLATENLLLYSRYFEIFLEISDKKWENRHTPSKRSAVFTPS